MTQIVDSYGRVARKLRLSVTDRCNFRCQFCMPNVPVWLPRSDILTYEEMHRVVSILASMGIEKIRLSGGEPLMRRGIESLVGLLRGVPRIQSVSITTNGFRLGEKAAALRKAGLSGVTVSLHSLKPDRFSEITGGGLLKQVLAGIRAAKENGFKSIKVNTVIIRGCNDDEILDLASLAVSGDVAVRFIEYMPLLGGEHIGGKERVFSGKEIIKLIRDRYELEPLPREDGSTAKRYKIADGAGEICLISSMTEPFCSDCDRIRVSADGKIVPCLFDKTNFDLRPLLRGGASDEAIASFVLHSFSQKAPGVETLLKYNRLEHVRPMYTIGG